MFIERKSFFSPFSREREKVFFVLTKNVNENNLKFQSKFDINFRLFFDSLYYYTLFILFIVVGLHFYGNNDNNLILSKWSISLESSFASLNTMVREQVGSHSEVYLPFVYSIFFYVLIGNLISNIPYSFAVNASVIVTLGFSVTIFMGVTILSLSIHKLKFFSYFIPSGTPLALVPLIVLIELYSNLLCFTVRINLYILRFNLTYRGTLHTLHYLYLNNNSLLTYRDTIKIHTTITTHTRSTPLQLYTLLT